MLGRLFFLLLILQPFFAFSDPRKCENSFGSRMYYDNQAIQRSQEDVKRQPKFTNLRADRALAKEWNKEFSHPKLLSYFLPKDVHFINHQLHQPGSQTAVKLAESGASIMARAYYHYKGHRLGTNVVFSMRALMDNFQQLEKTGIKQNWLVGVDANAAIIYLHGGGTKSTGAHVADTMTAHFKHYNIDVLALDLPWHAEGHREILGGMEKDIESLSVFAKKYIPPHVPVFVWGHSWGAVFAEKLMTMTDRSKSDFTFHRNLKGVMILSPPVDAAPNKSQKEKLQAYTKRLAEGKKRREDFAELEKYIDREMVEDGKINPLGSVYSLSSILELNQIVPEHKGKKWVPGLVIVGRGDSLVYVGFEELFDYYKKLENVDYRLLDELPLVHSPDKKARVGHLLADYRDPASGEPIHLHLGLNFITRQLIKQFFPDEGKRIKISTMLNDLSSVDYRTFAKFIEHSIPKEKQKAQKKSQQISDYIMLVKDYANDLSFREFVRNHDFYVVQKTSEFTNLMKESANDLEVLKGLMENYHAPHARVNWLLTKIVNSKSQEEYQDVLSEFQLILNPDFFRWLSNYKVGAEILAFAKDFKTIRTLINAHEQKFGRGAEISYTENFTGLDMKEGQAKARRILRNEEFSKFLNTASTRNLKRFMGDILQAIKEDRVQDIHDFLRAKHLSKEVKEQVMYYVDKVVQRNSVMEMMYIPNFKARYEDISFEKKDKEEFIKFLAIIESNISARKQIQSKLSAVQGSIKALITENHNLTDNIMHNLRLIKKGFIESITNIPESLIQEHQGITKKLEDLVKSEETALEDTDALSVHLTGASSSNRPVEIDYFATTFNKHEAEINQFMLSYKEYILHRRQFRRQLITAMERGELGEEYKNAVLEVYGVHSGGDKPMIGSESNYLKLEKNILDLAEAESKIYAYKADLNQLIILYKDTFSRLMQLIKIKEGEKHSFTASMLSKLLSIILVRQEPVMLTLDESPSLYEIETKSPENIIRYIRSNSKQFQQIHGHWNGLRSNLPPLLPTDSRVD